ncbi:hypothetical protein KEM56_006714 [Ascosphaera pollenicola]|nr:hypothetical protein KEM56_006714 [Ascosphaera pollenicola]
MPRASDAQDGDYVPPREIAHDLDKQYELRKRKISENQYYEGPDVPDERRGYRKRVRIDENELPPRPTTPEMKAQVPPDWFAMDRKAMKDWEHREKQKLAEIRMKQAVKYLHFFPNYQQAAIHFRISIKQLEHKLRQESQTQKGPKNKAGHQPFRGQMAESAGPSDAAEQVRVQQETQKPGGPGDKDLQANNSQLSGLPLLEPEDLIFAKPPGYDSLSRTKRNKIRKPAMKQLKQVRLMKAVECYRQGLFTDLEMGSRHFQVPVKNLMRELVLPNTSEKQKSAVRSSETLQHTSTEHQGDLDQDATEPMLPATEDVVRHIKPDPDRVEGSSMAVTTNGPFSEEEENEIMQEIRRRVNSDQQPSLSRIRDIANVRVLNRDGLNAPIVDINWVRDFLSRHEYLRRVYKNVTDQPSHRSNEDTIHAKRDEQTIPPEHDANHINIHQATASNNQDERSVSEHQLAVPTSSAQMDPALVRQPLMAAHQTSTNHPATTPIAEENRSAVSPAASHAPFQATERHTSITAQGHLHYSDRYSSASTYPPGSTTEPDPRTDQYPSNQSTHPTQNEEVSNSISEMSEREPPPRYLRDSDIEIRLRITYNDDTRIVALDPEIQISALMQKVAQKFGTTRPLRLQISDKDGMITIGDQEDLSFALADTRKWGAREGREIVQLQVGSSS